MVASSPERAEPTSSRQYLSAGFDPGNGTGKLKIGELELRIPSLIAPLHNAVYDAPEAKDGSLITYLGGSRTDLINQRWFAGSSAYVYSPNGHQKVVDDRKGKIKFGLHLLLGAIGGLSRRQEWKL